MAAALISVCVKCSKARMAWCLPAICFNLGAILFATVLLTLLLLAGTKAEHTLGKRALAIITKLTGLFLSALAAGMILEGIKNFFHLQIPG